MVDLIHNLNTKLYFTVEDVSSILNIKKESAWVLCNRYVKKGVFIRVKNNFYVLDSSLKNYDRDYFLLLANYIQVPSYISFNTALSYYEITTQVQRNYIESVSIKRSVLYNTTEATFDYHKIKKELYFSFRKLNNIFIATPEKAIVDSAYLISMNRYSLDLNALDFSKFDLKKVRAILKLYPKSTKSLIEKWMTL